MSEYVIDSICRLNQSTVKIEKRNLNNTSWEKVDLRKIGSYDRFIVFKNNEPDVCFNELNQIITTYGDKQIDEKEFSNIIDKKPNHIVISDSLSIYSEGFYVRGQYSNFNNLGPFKYLLVLKEVIHIGIASTSPPPSNKQVQIKPINQTKEKEIAKITMNPKEKYFLDSDRQIYSFDNNDEIPENSIIIGYYDDDSSDDEGHAYRDIIEDWFAEDLVSYSLKDIDYEFHVGKIISDDDDRISSEQKHYSPGYFIENLSGEIEGPFDFAILLELDTGKYNKSNSGKNKNNTPKVKEVKTMAVGNNVQDSFKQVMSMRMLEKIMSGNKDIDIGKLYLMQSIMTGEKLEMTDVIKSKLISQFDLDKNKEDLPIEKLLILQSLESGSLDIGQLIQMKMIGKLLDEDTKNCDNKKKKSENSDK